MKKLVFVLLVAALVGGVAYRIKEKAGQGTKRRRRGGRRTGETTRIYVDRYAPRELSLVVGVLALALVVPLLTPLPREECIEGGWLYDRDCPVLSELISPEGIQPQLPRQTLYAS